jgi:hypothetical protein
MADQFIMNYFEGTEKGGGLIGLDSIEIIPAEAAGKQLRRKWLFISNNSTAITMWLAFGDAGPAEPGRGIPLRPGEWYEQNTTGITTSAVHLIAEAPGAAYSWHIGK